MSPSSLARASILLVLIGCTSPATRPDTDGVPSRPTIPPRAAVIQANGGESPHWTVCTQDCPAPSPKSRPSAASDQAPAAELSEASALAPVATDAARAATSMKVSAPTPAPAVQPPPAPQPFAKLVLHFAVGSARLDADALTKLNQALPRLQRAATLRIAGRTDDTGSAETNDALAKARGLAVIEWLRVAERGIGASWTAHSQGACCYLAPNDTAAGRAANRRVEIEMYASAPAPRNPSSS